MPLYEFACGSCGHADVEVRPMSAPNIDECPSCHRATYSKQVSLPHSTQVQYHKPIEMYSIAVRDQAELEDFIRRAPDVDISTDPRDPDWGIPKVKSLHEKKQALKAAGFKDRNSYVD